MVNRGTGRFNGDGYLHAFIIIRCPTELRVTQEDHATWTPIVDGVGKHVRVHEQAPCLTGTKLSQFTPDMAKPEGGLTGIRTHTKQVEFKPGFDVTQSGRKQSLDAKSGLAGAYDSRTIGSAARVRAIGGQ